MNLNSFYNYSREAEEDDVDMDLLVKDDTTPVDDAEDGDLIEDPVDVSDISESEASHNEEASAGGVAIDDNVKDITMDPVIATEAFIRRRFNMSLEDLENAVDETIAEGDKIIADSETDENDPAISDDDELASVGATTVTVIPPAGGETEVSTDQPEELKPEDVIPEVETSADVAALEGLRRIWSLEDDEPDGSAAADVEFDVKTQNNDVNFKMEDKAITLEPNADSSDMGDDNTEEPEEPQTENSEEENEGEQTPENTEEPTENPEGGEEAWYNFI